MEISTVIKKPVRPPFLALLIPRILVFQLQAERFLYYVRAGRCLLSHLEGNRCGESPTVYWKEFWIGNRRAGASVTAIATTNQVTLTISTRYKSNSQYWTPPMCQLWSKMIYVHYLVSLNFNSLRLLSSETASEVSNENWMKIPT